MRPGDAGFVAVDAIVAMVILSSTLFFSLLGLQSAEHNARAVEDAQQAGVMAAAILHGETPALASARRASWRTSTELLDPVAGRTVCLTTVRITFTRDRRAFVFRRPGACA